MCVYKFELVSVTVLITSADYHYPAGPMVDAGGNFGTNGTFGTLMVEKPPPYPGAPQHTSVIPPGKYSKLPFSHTSAGIFPPNYFLLDPAMSWAIW